MPMLTTFTFGTTLPDSLVNVRPRIEAALIAEGFGVLTVIDVQATMKSKLDLDIPPQLILGACNPVLAHRAMQADPSVAALLPCNVVLRDDAGQTIVEAMDPRAVLGIVDAPAIREVALEASERLQRVIAALEPVAPENVA